ncbi:ArsR/SmtB family transcription factor [Methylobacterium oryzae]|uniref:Transcriptional regulator n=1 Tax=Methylobacterium oryzae TaxID=334852 RepID=A0ABU7TRS1_9HYPH
MDVTTAASILEALGNPTRLRILIELRRSGDTGLSVNAIRERLEIDAKSTFSSHLRQLVQVGLVTQERRSTTLLCRAPIDPMDTLVEFLRREAAHPHGKHRS